MFCIMDTQDVLTDNSSIDFNLLFFIHPCIYLMKKKSLTGKSLIDLLYAIHRTVHYD